MQEWKIEQSLFEKNKIPSGNKNYYSNQKLAH